MSELTSPFDAKEDTRDELELIDDEEKDDEANKSEHAVRGGFFEPDDPFAEHNGNHLLITSVCARRRPTALRIARLRPTIVRQPI